MRLAFRLLSLTIMLAFAAVTLAGPAERLLIYPFDKTQVTPADAGLSGVTEQAFDFDGETLVVWTAPPKLGQPVIFYLHGNAGNLANRAGRFRRFMDRGYGLIALAYPGSSGSTEAPSEDSLKRSAKLVWLEKHALLPLTFLPPSSSKTIVYGESLGAAVAIGLNASAASDHMKGVGPADAIILEAPFTSIKALAQHHYPALTPLQVYTEGQWDSLRWAAQLRHPLLVIHGTNDSLISIEMGRQIFSAAPSESKTFLAVKGAGHTDLWRSDTLPKLYAFIDQFALR
ncbi:alpha/beta hydrolase [Shimia sp. Alg240-R146]|uniref:alpha/beta hydrolase n=1 Tax=Shimia sp. Alg240-R146 TaxID=2993449 RepID=UPI0022E7FD4D|nr:alpha/beta hydrolase [Shimia sp. Alg240-R146]